MNLNEIDPAIAANPPVMPAAVTNLIGNSSSYNGLWSFTSSKPSRHVELAMGLIQPRFGAAYRIN